MSYFPSFQKQFSLNPLRTTGLLTPFLIGSYHEMFPCSANCDKSLKMKTYIGDYFFTLSLIGSINARIFILTNRQVVLIRLIICSYWPSNHSTHYLTLKQVTKCTAFKIIIIMKIYIDGNFQKKCANHVKLNCVLGPDCNCTIMYYHSVLFSSFTMAVFRWNVHIWPSNHNTAWHWKDWTKTPSCLIRSSESTSFEDENGRKNADKLIIFV